MTTIAFLGTGLMGAPMAARLAGAGHRVIVWNRTAEKLGALISAGMVGAATPAEAVDDADLICMALADASAVEDVLFGANGVAVAGRPAQLLIDFSTLGPVATRTLAERLQARCGVRWVDSPVSGGVNGAAAGKLIAFCGGEKADVDRARPILASLMARVNHLGPLGAGQAAKLCNQLIVATNVLAVAEALSLAKALGLQTAQIPEALAGGFADSQPLQIFGPRMAAGVTMPKLGEIALMLKDIEAAMSAASYAGMPGLLGQQVLAMYRHASERGFGREDIAALIRLYERPN